MRKGLILIGVITTVFLFMSNAIAVPQTTSKTLVNKAESIDKISNILKSYILKLEKINICPSCVKEILDNSIIRFSDLPKGICKILELIYYIVDLYSGVGLFLLVDYKIWLPGWVIAWFINNIVIEILNTHCITC
jgi:hypothetical protein